MDIQQLAKTYLEKEFKRLNIKLKQANEKTGVKQSEIDALERKIEIIAYLQTRCE